MTPPDVMTAEEAQSWRDDGVDGNRDEIARLCDTIIALHQRVNEAWAAGALATMEAGVSALRAEVDRLLAAAWEARARVTGAVADEAVARALVAGGCVDLVVALPLPAPPAPPQSPLPSPDGGTGPQGDGAPAGGLSVAVTGDGPTVEVWRAVWEDDGREPASPWPVEVWRHGDGWAARDMLSATRPVGDTPEAAILACRVLRGRRLRELVPPGMRTTDERVADAVERWGQTW